ncbi:MAG: hypothetical protein QOH97_2422 [Actinoplanes sp.]|jgi:hypothetical protein|nr:hypothetical protein [Actinoplanes sp.]
MLHQGRRQNALVQTTTSVDIVRVQIFGGVDVPDGVEIDTDQVHDFGQGMRAQVDQGFASAASRGAELHRHGVVFGAAIPGDVVLEVKNRYAQALENTDANLRAFREAATIFAQVAEQIARDFQSADLGSASAQNTVAALMADGITRANQVLGVTGTAAGWA